MLRIIAGEFKRHRLASPRDEQTARPIPDKVRGSIFNMLHGHLEGALVADVFAGTGAFAFEALSRGAGEAVLIENNRECLDLIRQNARTLGVEDRLRIIRADALGPAAVAAIPHNTHVIMCDPPYPLVADPLSRGRVHDQFARLAARLDDTGYALLRTPWPHADLVPDEHDPERARRVHVSMHIDPLRGPETHAYGSTAVHWYMRPVTEPSRTEPREVEPPESRGDP